MVTTTTRLRGMTWGHDRGVAPLLACSSEWRERTGVTVDWEVRSLREFGETPLVDLASVYDLLVIDHPFIGRAVAQGVLAPLDGHTAAGDAVGSGVGGCDSVYDWQEHRYALAIDTAAQVMASRPDLAAGRAVPTSWADVLTAAPGGDVGQAMNSTDVVPLFLTMCCAVGPAPFHERSTIPTDQGLAALDLLRALAEAVPPWTLDLNPIELLEAMATDAELWMTPSLFGYTNYSRDGYRPHRLAFHDAPTAIVAGAHGGSTLGGAGLAVSRTSQSLDAAYAYADFVASPDVQAGLYTNAGGQPGIVSAWNSPTADAVCGGFFTATRATMDRAYIRPRHAGYLTWQDGIGEPLAAFVRGEGSPGALLGEINRLYAVALVEAQELENS